MEAERMLYSVQAISPVNNTGPDPKFTKTEICPGVCPGVERIKIDPSPTKS